MSDDDPNREDVSAGEETSSVGLPDRIAETAIALKTGIPPQVQRSFFKVLSRVFTAGAEWPAKYLEGRGKISSARADAEAARYRAEAADIASQQKARDVVNRGSAKIAVEQFSDPDKAQRAFEYHAAHIIKEQENREEVLERTANDLRDNPPQSDSATEIDDDWLSAFLKEAATRTSEEYKTLFSRILSGEIRRPGTFSIGTVQSIARMDQRTSAIFQVACNLSSELFSGVSTRIISENFLPIGENRMASFGLSYSDYSLLVEEGLLRPQLSEQSTIRDTLYVGGYVFDIGGSKFFIKRSGKNPSYADPLHLGGPSFTSAGSQLRTIVSMSPPDEYLLKFAEWLETQNMELYKVTRTEGTQTFGEKVGTDVQ